MRMGEGKEILGEEVDIELVEPGIGQGLPSCFRISCAL
jgi:hypothetical protein